MEACNVPLGDVSVLIEMLAEFSILVLFFLGGLTLVLEYFDAREHKKHD